MEHIPFWIWTAVFGGVFGALGVLLSSVLRRIGFQRVSWVTALMIAGGVALSRMPATHDFLDQVTWSGDRTEQAMMTYWPEFFGYLKTAYPSDFEDAKSRLTALIRDASHDGPNTANEAGAEVIEDIRHKYSGFVRFASDLQLRSFFKTAIDLYNTVQEDDPALCTRVAFNGSTSFSEKPGAIKKYNSLISANGLALFHAARSGIDAPIARRQATDEDWAEVYQQVVADGTPQNYLDVLASQDTGSLIACPALVAVLTAINELSDEAASSVRATFSAEVAGS